MRIEFTCRNYNAADKLKDIVTRKIEKLDKFFEDDTKVKIVLKKTADREKMEITISVPGGLLRAEVSGGEGDMYKNIDLAIPKLEKQILRHHDKMKSKKFKLKDFDLAATETKEEPARQVVREKSYVMVPMTVDDAIEEMELLGHDFFVFLNRETANVTVLYTRTDGNFGLIEAVR